jgi:hypothetical protein
MKNKKLVFPRPQGNNKYNSITAQKVFKAPECSTASCSSKFTASSNHSNITHPRLGQTTEIFTI